MPIGVGFTKVRVMTDPRVTENSARAFCLTCERAKKLPEGAPEGTAREYYESVPLTIVATSGNDSAMQMVKALAKGDEVVIECPTGWTVDKLYLAIFDKLAKPEGAGDDAELVPVIDPETGQPLQEIAPLDHKDVEAMSADDLKAALASKELYPTLSFTAFNPWSIAKCIKTERGESAGGGGGGSATRRRRSSTRPAASALPDGDDEEGDGEE